MRLRSIAGLVAAVLAVAVPSRAAAQEAPKPILETVAGLGEYDVLLAVLKETGLDQALVGSGPFTLYAPNNAAFARIPADTLAALKADKARLTRVLKHHVIPSKFTGIDMMNAPIYSKIPTAAGDSMTIYHDKGGIKVDYKLVKVVDVPATNGVVHTVREVMLVP